VWHKLTNNFRCTVGRAIVDHKDFPFVRGKILLQNADDRLLNEAFVIIGVDQYTYERSGQSLPSKQNLKILATRQTTGCFAPPIVVAECAPREPASGSASNAFRS